jgi:quinol monooxygenase YgiN
MTDSAAGTITLVVTMQFKAEQEATFLGVARSFAEWVRVNEPGTLLYTLSKDPSREHTYVWVERYRDEAALEAHRTSAPMTEVLDVVRGCLDGRRSCFDWSRSSRLRRILTRLPSTARER